MSVFKGIDISQKQEHINLFLVQEQVDFIILKVGSGLTKDMCFERFYEECRSLFIPCGVYYESTAVTLNNVREEIQFLKNRLADKKLEYPVYINFDQANHFSDDNLHYGLGFIALCQEMLSGLTNIGYYVGVHTRTPHILQNPIFQSVTRWLSPADCGGVFREDLYGSIDMIQNTLTLHLDGEEGFLNENIAYVNFPETIRSLCKNHLGSEYSSFL